jgi:hypothetical protein
MTSVECEFIRLLHKESFEFLKTNVQIFTDDDTFCGETFGTIGNLLRSTFSECKVGSTN